MRNLIIILLGTIPSVALGATVTFECVYPTYSDSEGSHLLENELKISFLIDQDSEKSYILGNNGSAEVILIPGVVAGSLSFIEVTDIRNVMTTTITSEGESVHSRNSVMFTELIASQYYGSCTSK